MRLNRNRKGMVEKNEFLIRARAESLFYKTQVEGGGNVGGRKQRKLKGGFRRRFFSRSARSRGVQSCKQFSNVTKGLYLMLSLHSNEDTRRSENCSRINKFPREKRNGYIPVDSCGKKGNELNGVLASKRFRTNQHANV